MAKRPRIAVDAQPVTQLAFEFGARQSGVTKSAFLERILRSALPREFEHAANYLKACNGAGETPPAKPRRRQPQGGG